MAKFRDPISKVGEQGFCRVYIHCRKGEIMHEFLTRVHHNVEVVSSRSRTQYNKAQMWNLWLLCSDCGWSIKREGQCFSSCLSLIEHRVSCLSALLVAFSYSGHKDECTEEWHKLDAALARHFLYQLISLLCLNSDSSVFSVCGQDAGRLLAQ